MMQSRSSVHRSLLIFFRISCSQSCLVYALLCIFILLWSICRRVSISPNRKPPSFARPFASAWHWGGHARPWNTWVGGCILDSLKPFEDVYKMIWSTNRPKLNVSMWQPMPQGLKASWYQCEHKMITILQYYDRRPQPTATGSALQEKCCLLHHGPSEKSAQNCFLQLGPGGVSLWWNHFLKTAVKPDPWQPLFVFL